MTEEEKFTTANIIVMIIALIGCVIFASFWRIERLKNEKYKQIFTQFPTSTFSFSITTSTPEFKDACLKAFP